MVKSKKGMMVLAIFISFFFSFFSINVIGAEDDFAKLEGQITIEDIPMYYTEIEVGNKSDELNLIGEYAIEIKPGVYPIKVNSLLPTEGTVVRLEAGETKEVNIDYTYEELGLNPIMEMDDYFVETEPFNFEWKHTNIYNTMAFANNKNHTDFRYEELPKEINFAFHEEVSDEIREVTYDFFEYIEDELDAVITYEEIEWKDTYDIDRLFDGSAINYPDLAIVNYTEDMQDSLPYDRETVDNFMKKFDNYDIVVLNKESYEEANLSFPNTIRHELGHTLGLRHPPNFNKEGTYVGYETIMGGVFTQGDVDKKELHEYAIKVLKIRYSTHITHEWRHFKEIEDTKL